MKCFYCGNEIEESQKDNCPYCGKVEIMTPTKIVKYLLLFLSLFCIVIGSLVFTNELGIIMSIIVGIILLITCFFIKPKMVVYVKGPRRKITSLQLKLFIMALALITGIILSIIRI